MDFDKAEFDLQPTSEPEIQSTAFGALPVNESTSRDPDDVDHMGKATYHSPSVPWPDATYVIRDADSGNALTLIDGEPLLAPHEAGDRAFHWECVEARGWLGFRNRVSGRFLGHDDWYTLRCASVDHGGWEKFCVRARPDGGYVLLIKHYESLWHVGLKVENGIERLEKVGEGGSGGMTWEFIKVD